MTAPEGAFNVSPSRGLKAVIERLKTQAVETPSWGYGSAGTRFKTFHTPGTARDVWEKVEDAALVHRLTGVAPTMAIHIPWDKVDDYSQLRDRALEAGIRIGSVNPNLFQEDEYRLGSLANPDGVVRKKALDHIIECIEIAKIADSNTLSLWFADGTNYPGQGSFRERRRLFIEGLTEVYAAMPATMRLVLEYKFYEPAVYHTDIADWGQSLTICQKLGERAQVLVDLGHHAQGANVEHIVATLLDEARLGGFDLNSRKYGDDDLLVGATNPYELFLIMVEIVSAEDSQDASVRETAERILFKIDQCAMIEEKVPAMLRSVIAMQTAYAKALLVDMDALYHARQAGEVLTANDLLRDAYESDVRPLLHDVRAELGVPVDPIAAYRGSQEERRRIEKRVGTPASWH